MRLGRDLTGKPIFSVTDGRNLGTVKDIYMNQALDQITGVFTGQEGVLRRKTYLIPRESVVVFGIDAILVKNAEVIIEAAENEAAADWVRLSKLRGREVDTPNGTRVANIGDIVIGEEGDLLGFALAKVHVEGPIAEYGAIARSAIVDTGSEDSTMTIDITKAETTTLTAAPETTIDAETKTEPAPEAETEEAEEAETEEAEEAEEKPVETKTLPDEEV